MVSGSVKLVYALIFSLFIGFGLQIGSDMFLLLYPAERTRLNDLSTQLVRTVTLNGAYVSDTANGSVLLDAPVNGTWIFKGVKTSIVSEVVNNCHRPPGSPWYLRRFPKWTEFLLVPLFSTVASLASQQPWRSWELPAMVTISCISYAVNFISSRFLFDRPDVVASASAFVVGVLGNAYARTAGGTAFTAMVGGVGFLIPGVFAETGGFTAEGSGIDIGGKILEVTIGITVGLFMSQTLVYAFGGARKGTAVWSF